MKAPCNRASGAGRCLAIELAAILWHGRDRLWDRLSAGPAHGPVLVPNTDGSQEPRGRETIPVMPDRRSRLQRDRGRLTLDPLQKAGRSASRPYGGLALADPGRERLVRLGGGSPEYWACSHYGETIISLPHAVQRALTPTISQAMSSDTILRRHFGHVYPAGDSAKSYCGPI